MSANFAPDGIDAKRAAAAARDPAAPPSELEGLDCISEAVDRLLAKHPRASAALLERLSHSSDKATRRNVVKNPGASKETLLRLAPQFPGDFFTNPAFDWLLVDDPDLMQKLGPGVLKSVLKRPDCPESFMKWAVTRGGEQEQLAVAMNPAASAALVEILSRIPGKVGDAARSHVNAVVRLPPEAADGRSIMQSEVRTALAELTPDEATSYWKRGILGPSKWAALNPSARLAVLGLSDWVYRDVWLARHPDRLAALPAGSVPAWLTLERQGSDDDFALARNPDTAQDVLEGLAGSKNTDLVVAAAGNPSMPTATLVRLAAHKRSSVVQAVGANQATPEATLRLLAQSKLSAVRASVAGNPAAPPDLVAMLAKDRSSEVLKASRSNASADLRAARSIRTPADELASFSASKKSDVRLAVARNPRAPEGARAAAFESLMAEAGPNKLVELAEEPGCPKRLRRYARSRRWWRDLCQAVEKHRLEPDAEPLPDEPDVDTLARMLDEEADAMLLSPGQTLLARALGFREGDLLALPNQEADGACNAKARAVRLMGLTHRQAGPEAMVKRSRSTDWVERLAIACNPACAPSILDSLRRDANQVVAQQVASTRQLKSADQERREAIVDAEPEAEVSMSAVIAEISGRLQKCRTWLLQGSSWWPTLSYAQRLGVPAWQDELERLEPVDLFALLEEISAWSVPPNGSGDRLGELWNRRRRDKLLPLIGTPAFVSSARLEPLVASASAEIRRLAALNPNLSESQVMRLSEDARPEVRRASILGGRLPAEQAVRLMGDTDASVRAAAISAAPLAGEMVRSLAQSRDPDVRTALAARRGLPRDVQEALAADARSAVREALAANACVAENLLSSLAVDRKPEVRQAVAGNPSTTGEVLAALAFSRDDWSRLRVTRNAAAPVGLLLRLAVDRDRVVRDEAAAQLRKRGDISDGDFALIAGDKDPDIRCLAARNPSAPASLLEQLAADQSNSVRLGVAWNVATPGGVIARLVDDQTDTVKDAALAHSGATVAALERSASDKGRPSRRAVVAANPNTPVNVLEALAGDPDTDVRLALLKNPNLPLRLTRKLAAEADDIAKIFPALVNAARSAATTTDELQWLGRESYFIVRFVALANERYPTSAREADRSALHDEILNGRDSRPAAAAATAVSELLLALSALDLVPARPDARWAAKAAKSKDWLARVAVPLSNVAPPSLLQLLLDDPVDVVRQLAIKRLRSVTADRTAASGAQGHP